MSTMIRPKNLLTMLGALIVLGLGTMAVSVARSDDRAVKAEPTSKQALRERVVKLRTDVELLQVDRDSVNSALVKVLTDLRVGELTNHRQSVDHEMDHINKLIEIAAKARQGASPSTEAIDRWKKELTDSAKKNAADVSDACSKKQAEYGRLVSQLNEKKLELDEAEEAFRKAR